MRGLLADGRRKSMQPMAARLGVDHQRLQQFITSSTWDYVAVRRNVARWFAASQPVEALVVDDTGFPKDGTASPCVARQYSGTLGKVGNCQVAVSVHLVNEHASCAADWRLFCPESWDDAALADPVAAARAARRRRGPASRMRCAIREKWRLALEMIDEMTGPGGWGVLEEITAAGGARPVVVADAGYGDNTAFRVELDARGWQYAIAVKGTTSAYAGDAQPGDAEPGRRARPPRPGPPTPPRRRTCASSPSPSADQIQPVTWRQGTRATNGNPDAAMTSCFMAIRVRPANRRHPPRRRRQPAGMLAAGRMAARSRRAHRLLAVRPCRRTPPSPSWPGWPRSAGGSSTTTASSRPASGLDHFEGRSFTGWHRHVTLAVLAQAFITMIRTDPKVAAPG